MVTIARWTVAALCAIATLLGAAGRFGLALGALLLALAIHVYAMGAAADAAARRSRRPSPPRNSDDDLLLLPGGGASGGPASSRIRTRAEEESRAPPPGEAWREPDLCARGCGEVLLPYGSAGVNTAGMQTFFVDAKPPQQQAQAQAQTPRSGDPMWVSDLSAAVHERASLYNQRPDPNKAYGARQALAGALWASAGGGDSAYMARVG